MNFTPLGKRVLVKRSQEQTTTPTGIIIPDNAQEKPSIGEVVAVSSEVSELSCGNKVAFGKYAGNEITLNDQKYLIINTEDIFGIIK